MLDNSEQSQLALNLRVPADLHRQLRIVAQREGNGVSAVVRRLLTDALRRAATNDLPQR